LPYAAEPLRNNNRYSLIATANQPVSADALEADANYNVDSLNDLYIQLGLVVSQGLPGVNNPANTDKFPVTDGVATVSWTKILAAHFSAQCIPTAALQPGCVTNPILGAGSVLNANIVAGAVQDNNINDNVISFDKITSANNTHFQEFFNLQNLGTLSGAVIANNSLPATAITDNSLPGTKITINTLPAAALVPNSLTTAQMSPAIQWHVGMLISWALSGAAPTGWVLCNGAAISRAVYALLFTAIGVTYGAGDGSTTFNIPDLRGRATFGVDTTSGSPTGGRIAGNPPLQPGSSGGEENHTLTITEIPSHIHGTIGLNGSLAPLILSPGATYGLTATNINTEATGGGAAHNNMPPYMLTNIIIYAGV
jgi:microcystin-dependent protein